MKFQKRFILNFIILCLFLSLAGINAAWQLLGALIVAIIGAIMPKTRTWDPTVTGASFNIQTSDTRENFRNAAHIIADSNGLYKIDEKGNKVPDISKIDLTQLTQGYLCTMVDLLPQQQVMQFSIVDTQQVSGSPVIPITRQLSMQDSFVVANMSYFLYPYFFATNNQQSPNFNLGSLMTPLTYVSTFPDNQPLSAPFMDAGCSLFWNTGAYISIEVDKKVVIPYWDTLKHYYAPQTQATMFWNPALAPPGDWPLFVDQFDGATDSSFPVEPTVVFGGGRQNIVKLNLPANIPASIPPFNLTGYGTTFILKACLIFRGILAQNSTSVK